MGDITLYNNMLEIEYEKMSRNLDKIVNSNIPSYEWLFFTAVKVCSEFV